ncbi:YncE family protein [Albibacterium bauzanense]|uniref:ATP-binding protein n=1 Tax=Albibacterium bauzanense TaxID=653929 RepID=A0A4R1LNJ4_9SPHI|nr:hypothetical protein [Albibacterium bauzanense]TCK80606.1 hypothetical protein C8N28_2348 [Albibacterium bauzanense]
MKKTTNKVFSYLAFTFCIAAIVSCNNTNQNDNSNNDEVVQDTVASLTQVWKTDSTFTGSESTLYNPANNTIYVSCGNTDPSAKDGDGFIALLNSDGSVKNMKWVTGLNAPKGMAILNGKLYVTDVDEVKIIDLETASIEKTIPVEGAKFLNDLASDGTTVYFSDSDAGTVYSLNQAGSTMAVINNADGINGLELYEGSLYTLDKQGLNKYDTTEYKGSLLNSEVKGGDGLVILNDSTFVASRWAGEIYLIKGDKATLLVDTKAEKSNTADIGFIADQNLVIVPTFMKNEVAAYKLNY